MTELQRHSFFAAFAGIALAVFGISSLHIHPEHALLAAVIVFVTGLLPDIDQEPGVGPTRDIGGMLAAVAPLVVLEMFPNIKAGGTARIALVVICSFLLCRLIIVTYFENFTNHRGMVHSIPAAIVTAQISYLLFWDMFLKDRLFVTAAAFAGYFLHLLIDGYGNIDLTGKKGKKAPVLKLTAPTIEGTLATYAVVLLLGWFVWRDLVPQIRG